MVSTLANPSVDNEFVHTEAKEGSKPLIVVTAATLADIVTGTAGCSIEVQCELVAFGEWFLTELARRIIFCRWCYSKV